MTKLFPGVLAAALLASAGAVSGQGQGMGTAFNYQGQLKRDGVPVDATCTFWFKLWDDPVAGSQLGIGQVDMDLEVANGLFTAPLNFQAGAFDGDARWLEVGVRCPGDGGFSTLDPRQELTPAPYALFAAEVAGTGAANTLDQAYDQGGPGVGRSITADAGPVDIAGPDGLTVTGNVGVGTTSIANPSFWSKILQIYGDAHSAISVRNHAKQWDMGAASGGDLRFNEDGTSRVTIAPGGDVGIGTTSITNPSYWSKILQIYGDAHSGISVRNHAKQWDMGAASGGDLRFNEDGTASRVTIQPGGNVGIGTTNPTRKLHVEGGDQAIYGVATAGAYYVRPYGVVAGVRTNASLNTAGGFRTDIYTASDTPNIAYVIGAECIIVDDGDKHVRGLSIVLNEAESDDHGIEIRADAPAYAIYSPRTGPSYFGGDFEIGGTLSKAAGSFKVDHPLDPANKYLYHAFVESPDMMNVYNGNAILDADGEAVVDLPDYFEALNRDFRYQLTAVGAPGPDLYIAQEISDNRLRIAGGKPGMKVSWQVTGIRQDPYADAHRIPVELDKPGDERGTYLHPEVYGMPEEMGLHGGRRETTQGEREGSSRNRTQQEYGPHDLEE